MAVRAIGTMAAAMLALLPAACGEMATVPGPRDTAGADRGGPGGKPVSFASFTDIPVPQGAKLNIDRTLVLGSDNDWIGRLTFDSGLNVVEAYDFFKREMAGFGWREVTSVRATISVLTYQRDNRIATLQIIGGRLSGSTIDVTVSPRGPAPN
ncbi:MAG: hypothetical protein HY521_15125 [Proteobacteria bacterium]|nr:hypothetical protein [Pseudomonadota bacterium]